MTGKSGICVGRMVVVTMGAVMVITGVLGQADPCQPDGHSVLDDHRRDVTNMADRNSMVCDINLETGWYRFKVNGSDAVMPTTCVEPNHCGTQAPIWLDLKDELPPVGQEVTSRACSSWGVDGGKTLCCFYPYRVSLRNCGGFLVYRLSSSLACNIGYCVDRVPGPPTTEASTSTTTTSTTITTATTTTTLPTTTSTTTTTTTPPPPPITTTTTTSTFIDTTSTDFWLDPWFTGDTYNTLPPPPPDSFLSETDRGLDVHQSGVSPSSLDSFRPFSEGEAVPTLEVTRSVDGDVFIHCVWDGSQDAYVITTWYEHYGGSDGDYAIIPVEDPSLLLGNDVNTGQTIFCSVEEYIDGSVGPQTFSQPLFLGLRVKEDGLTIREDGVSANLTLVLTVPIPCPAGSGPQDADSGPCRLGVSFLAFDNDGNEIPRLRFSSCYLEIPADACDGDVCKETHVQAVLFPDPQSHPQGHTKDAVLMGAITYFGQGHWEQNVLETKLSLQDLKYGRCHVITDPHIITLDGNVYNLYVLGTFTLYQSRSRTLIFQVHIRVSDCGDHKGFCVCGVVVQEGVDVISVDNCHGRHLAGRVEVTFPYSYLSDDVRIYDGADKKSITIVFTSGRRLRIYVEEYGLSLALFVPDLDSGTGSGLCGNYDDDPANDLEKKDGTIGGDENDLVSTMAFVESWRIRHGESLFEKPPDVATTQEHFYPETRCDCSPFGNGDVCPQTSLFNDVIPSITTYYDAVDSYLFRSVFPAKDHLGFPSITAYHDAVDSYELRSVLSAQTSDNDELLSKPDRKRFIRKKVLDKHKNVHNDDEDDDVTSHNEAKKGGRNNDQDFLPPKPVPPEPYFFKPDHVISAQIFFPRWPKAGGPITEARASDACATALFETPVTLTCADYGYVGPLLSVVFDFCQQDIQIKRDMSWAAHTIRMVQSACEFSAIEHAHNFTYGASGSPQWPQALKTALACPLGCVGGSCGEAGCVCHHGYGGPACDVKQDVLTSTDTPVLAVSTVKPTSTRMDELGMSPIPYRQSATQASSSPSSSSSSTSSPTTTTTTRPTTTTTMTTTSTTPPPPPPPSPTTTTTTTTTPAYKHTQTTTTSSLLNLLSSKRLRTGKSKYSKYYKPQTSSPTTPSPPQRPRPASTTTQTPHGGLDGATEHQACDLSLEQCTLVTFNQPFTQTTLGCEINPVKMTRDGVRVLDHNLATSSVLSTTGQLMCVLPYVSYLHQIFQNVPHFNAIRIQAKTSDNSVVMTKYLTVYDSSCLSCLQDGRYGCTVKPNTCYIDNKCYTGLSPKPYDVCLQCVPAVDKERWSPNIDNAPPVVHSQSSVVIFKGQNARMRINAYDPEGSKVILGVNRSDAFIKEDGEFVWRSTGNDSNSNFLSEEQAFTITAKDVCNSTTALRLKIRSVPCDCANGGRCVDAKVTSRGGVEYTCQCPATYTGSRCEWTLDPCLSDPCHRGRCVDAVNGSYRCLCPAGFSGVRCEKHHNPCLNRPCHPGVTCTTDGSSGFSCGVCPKGYTGDGVTCTEKTVCDPDTCFQGVDCRLDRRSKDGHTCGQCPRFYSGNGRRCYRSAIPACKTGVCSKVSRCQERRELPGYKCGPCPRGYIGDGVTCTPQCNVTCGRRQMCVSPDVCGCIHGYVGHDCDIPTCYPKCFNGGTCIQPNTCECQVGFTGSYCEKSQCDLPCLNGGRCVGHNTCVCPNGFAAQQCQQLACPLACQNGGVCIGPQLCRCPQGYQGTTCQTPTCHPPCLNGGKCREPGQCQCQPGYRGDQCQTALCFPACKNGGKCKRRNTCKCPSGYSGPRCQDPICVPSCMNGGRCVGPSKCLCPYGWSGAVCDQPVCHFPCLHGGVCINPDQCSCPRGYSGVDCSRRTRRTSGYWKPFYQFAYYYYR